MTTPTTASASSQIQQLLSSIAARSAASSSTSPKQRMISDGYTGSSPNAAAPLAGSVYGYSPGSSVQGKMACILIIFWYELERFMES